jgi:antitoxin Xre/MbcA/ParS-like protein
MPNTLLVTPKDEPETERISRALGPSARLQTIQAGETTPAKLKQFSQPDLVIVDSAGVSLIEIKMIVRAFPKSVVIVASKRVSTEKSEENYKAGVTAVVPLNSLQHALTNVRRILGERAQANVELKQPKASPEAFEHTVIEGLHDPNTGRLSAQAIADTLGISATALAKSIGLTPSALSKRPDAKAAQRSLRDLEFSIAALRRLLGSETTMRAWLNAPNPDLGQEPPIHLLTKGSASELASYIRSALAGQPT